MTDEELEVIKAREQAATPGPWMIGLGAPLYPRFVIDFTYVRESEQRGVFEAHKANKEFIAHAREDVPALVAEVERLRTAAAERYGAGSLPAVAILVDGKHVRTYCGSTCGVNLAAWRPGE